MSTPNNGGPAFPRIDGLEPDGFRTGVISTDGMTLRDYFAAKAIHACYAEYFAGLARHEYQCEPGWQGGIARHAYEMADAMLQARGES